MQYTSCCNKIRCDGPSSGSIFATTLPSTPVYYAVVSGRNVLLRGHTGFNGRYEITLGASVNGVQIIFFNPANWTAGYSGLLKLNPGNSVTLPDYFLKADLIAANDTDEDGLPDTAEFVLGTDLLSPDSDGDGVKDGPEVQQGTDPLDGRPARTGIIATADTPGVAQDVCAVNDRAVVADGAAGISVFDVVNGQNPVVVGRVDTPGSGQRVACVGNLVALADGSAGLAVIDIADPPAARISYELNTTALGGPVQSVTAAGGIAYVGLLSGQLVSVDLASGTILARTNIGEPVQDISIEGDTLYALTPTKLYAVPLYQGDLAIAGSVVSPYDGPGNARLFAGGGIAYAVHGRGYNTFSLANPAQPVLIAAGRTTQVGWKQIVANGSGLGVAAGSPTSTDDASNDISLYDLRNPALTDQFLTTFVTPGSARAVSIYNGLAYVADGDAGIQVINYLAYDIGGVLPTIALATNFANHTIEEGQTVRVSANVTDDVQVRNVEFYVDGAKVATDGNFPFEHRFIAPRLVDQPSFTLRARATDTGGNATWTDIMTVTLTADTTAPRISTVSPHDGDNVGNIGAVAVFFNEPINGATFSPDAFKLTEAGPDGLFGTADDHQITNGVIENRDDVAGSFVNFAGGLSPGYYRAELSNSVTDRAGNALATGRIWSFHVFNVGDDRDSDCVPDALEPALSLDPNKSDTDGNGIPDGQEDFDHDGLSNCGEVLLDYDATRPDTDGDGILDGAEDTDRDGLTDGAERLIHHTDPFDPDSDGDQFIDGDEVGAGSDPLDANSRPTDPSKSLGESDGSTLSIVNQANPSAPGLPNDADGSTLSIVNQANPSAPGLPNDVDGSTLSIVNQANPSAPGLPNDADGSTLSIHNQATP